jgi:hypothetical protein
MGPIGSGTLDEAYQWLHATRPEFDGWLSNHGPQARSCRVPSLTASRRTGG